MNFSNNSVGVNNIKRGEILVSTSNSADSYTLSTLNLPSISTLPLSSNNLQVLIPLSSKINILSVSFWGKDYSNCAPNNFRFVSITEPGVVISYQNNPTSLKINFPSKTNIAKIDDYLGINNPKSTSKTTCYNNKLSNNKLLVSKIIILYSDTNKSNTSITSLNSAQMSNSNPTEYYII